MKWSKGRKKSGEFQLLPPAQPVQLNHYIDVRGQDNARLIAEQLYNFSTSIRMSPADNGIGGPTIYQVRASHRYIPEVGKGNIITAEMALARAQKSIRQVISQFGGVYAGWDRNLLPAEPSRHQHHNDDGDEDSNPMGPPLPFMS
jgi:hypothetical protein